MTDLEKAIRKMIAEEFATKEFRERCGYCTGLARKIESGFDQNPRTVAAVAIIRRLLEVTGQALPDVLED